MKVAITLETNTNLEEIVSALSKAGASQIKVADRNLVQATFKGNLSELRKCPGVQEVEDVGAMPLESVLVTVDSASANQSKIFDQVVANLRQCGMHVEKAKKNAGLISGKVNEFDRKGLLNVPHVTFVKDHPKIETNED